MIEVFENPGHAACLNAGEKGELPDHYPDAKLILTICDPERWYKSAASIIFPMSMRRMETDDPAMAV